MKYIFVLLCTCLLNSHGLPNSKDSDLSKPNKDLTEDQNKLEDKNVIHYGKGEVGKALHFQLDEKYKTWRLNEKRAKTVARKVGDTKALFRRKRWNIKSIWGEEQEEEQEEYWDEYALCQMTCWAGWQTWGRCSSNCGNGGIRVRTRNTRPNTDCGCPGVSYQAEACNRRCYNGGTAATEDSCSCSAGFSGRCCENKITCGDPGVPQNGMATPYGNSHNFGTVVRYSCNRGYTIAGTVNTRRCNENGRWTGVTPVCQRVRCRNIGAPRFGFATSSSILQYETIVQFSCEVGYFLQGSETSICQADGSWSHPLPICNKGGCGDPGPINHGRTLGADFSFDSVVRYECNEGYVLVGSAERRCQADGRWSCEQPRCLTADSLLKKCPLLDDLENGQVVTTQGYLYQSIAAYSCKEGHFIDGHEHRACQVNEEWSGNKPECKAILCEPLTAPLHGQVIQPEGLVAYGASASFSCNHGHVLEGDSERSCGGNGPVGIWSGIQPSCQAISCGAPAAPSNGRIVGYSYGLEDNVTVECGPGFYLQGSYQLTCSREGVWIGNTDDNPLCVECPLNEYSSGISSSTNCTACPDNSGTTETGSSDSRQCRCERGYQRESDGEECKGIICPLPPVLPGTSVVRSCAMNYGGSCQFDCQSGYVRFLGHFYRTCSGTGQWTGEPLQCAPCPQNTYKLDSVSCASCPPNSHTLGVNSSRTDCIPLDGFQISIEGLILDIDECSSEVTNPCADRSKCVNNVGGAYCDCAMGTVLVPNPNGARDLHSCITDEKECPSLTAPLNGGLECNITDDVAACKVYCDMDYEFMDLDTFQIRCGPDTGFEWSHTVNNQSIPPCVSTVFGDPSMNVLVSYPDADCAELTQNQKQEAVKMFVDLVESEGVCYKNPGYGCEVMKAETVCADEPGAVLKFDRKKRDVQDTDKTDAVSFNFTFKLNPIVDKTSHACDDDMLCREKYDALLEFTSWRATESLTNLVANCDLCIRSDDGSTLQAELTLDQDVSVTCPPGAVRKYKRCVCMPGLTYNQESNSCYDNDNDETGSGEEHDTPEIDTGSGEEHITPEINTMYNCPHDPNPCTAENIEDGLTLFTHKDYNNYFVECNPANIGECRVLKCPDQYVFSEEEATCVWGQ